MKLIHFLTAFFAFALPTMVAAETANRTTMTFREFVAASGCEIRENSTGQLNLYAVSGGNCPFGVTQAFVGNYHRMVEVATPGDDGVFGTPDDGTREVSVTDN